MKAISSETAAVQKFPFSPVRSTNKTPADPRWAPGIMNTEKCDESFVWLWKNRLLESFMKNGVLSTAYPFQRLRRKTIVFVPDQCCPEGHVFFLWGN